MSIKNLAIVRAQEGYALVAHSVIVICYSWYLIKLGVQLALILIHYKQLN